MLFNTSRSAVRNVSATRATARAGAAARLQSTRYVRPSEYNQMTTLAHPDKASQVRLLIYGALAASQQVGRSTMHDNDPEVINSKANAARVAY